jgi:hypothetical protein
VVGDSEVIQLDIVRISPPVIRPESMPSAEITSSFGCSGRRGHADGRTACGHCTTMAHISDECSSAGCLSTVWVQAARETWKMMCYVLGPLLLAARALLLNGYLTGKGNGFHAFRHANATPMSNFGASQELRQQRLGHADGSPVTETIYTHVISEDGKRIAAKLGNAVWGVLDRNWM